MCVYFYHSSSKTVFNLSLLLQMQNLICKHAEVSSNWIQEPPFSLILSLDAHLNIAGQSQAWGKSKHDMLISQFKMN